MKQLILALTCILIALTPCSAQGPNTDNKSLLWKISGKDLTKPSYLFGTIHIICKDKFVWTDAMQNSIEQTEKVCMEMDLDDPMLMMQVMNLMRATDGKKLADYFSEEDYSLVKAYYKDSLGVSLALYSNMKPFVLVSVASTAMPMCDSSLSYELVMSSFAKKENMEILGLETAKEQIGFFESIPTDSIIQEVLSLAKNGDDEDMEELDRMIDAYTAQDLPRLHNAMLNSDMHGLDTETFLVKRNANWITKMEEYMSSNAIFFAVGAGHLWGKTGVIQLLRDRGYTVTPVK